MRKPMRRRLSRSLLLVRRLLLDRRLSRSLLLGRRLLLDRSLRLDRRRLGRRLRLLGVLALGRLLRHAAPPSAEVDMWRRAWRDVDRTDVPQAMQKLDPTSSMFSHSGQKVSTKVSLLEWPDFAASSIAASSRAAWSMTRIRITRTPRITKPQISPMA